MGDAASGLRRHWLHGVSADEQGDADVAVIASTGAGVLGWELNWGNYAMRQYFFGSSFALFIILSWSASASETAVLYRNGILTPLAVPGALSSAATSINDSGQILGFYDTPFVQTFLYSSGSFSTLNVSPPGATTTSPFGINNLGPIVGSYETSSSFGSFIYNGGNNYTPIPGPSDPIDITAYGINDSGQVVGQYRTSQVYYSGFIYTGGNYTTLSVSGFATEANGINNAGQVVGYYHDFDKPADFGFLYDNGNYTILAVPGATNTEANGINNLGQIVGYYDDGTGIHSFLYSNGNYTTIGNFQAFGINDEGDVVGAQGQYSIGGVPEPSTWAMMVVGFVGIGFAGYFRRRFDAISKRGEGQAITRIQGI
jgi:probable HAF family extracellular repeat protein